MNEVFAGALVEPKLIAFKIYYPPVVYMAKQTHQKSRKAEKLALIFLA